MNSRAQIKVYELLKKIIQLDNDMSGRSIWKSKGQITISNDGYATSRTIAAGGVTMGDTGKDPVDHPHAQNARA